MSRLDDAREARRAAPPHPFSHRLCFRRYSIVIRSQLSPNLSMASSGCRYCEGSQSIRLNNKAAAMTSPVESSPMLFSSASIILTTLVISFCMAWTSPVIRLRFDHACRSRTSAHLSSSRSIILTVSISGFGAAVCCAGTASRPFFGGS